MGHHAPPRGFPSSPWVPVSQGRDQPPAFGNSEAVYELAPHPSLPLRIDPSTPLSLATVGNQVPQHQICHNIPPPTGVCGQGIQHTAPCHFQKMRGGCKVPLSQPQITLSLLDGKPSERGENSD